MTSVQKAIFSKRISRFLANLFEMPAVAFQTLYFHRGSEQGFHQDTAFVYVDNPLHFAASWIALEDVEEGSGELQYHPGSHRLPDEIFPESRTKALLPGDDSSKHYSRGLQRKCEEAGLEKQQFRPRKGDVLIWAADLVHGGAGIHNTSTRRSLVTHYCPEDSNPPYATLKKGNRTAVSGNWIMSAY
jgi:ectoine hydroxylase-related dioxygenase (phytanoyl-CoA dioxygenase family)